MKVKDTTTKVMKDIKQINNEMAQERKKLQIMDVERPTKKWKGRKIG